MAVVAASPRPYSHTAELAGSDAAEISASVDCLPAGTLIGIASVNAVPVRRANAKPIESLRRRAHTATRQEGNLPGRWLDSTYLSCTTSS